MVLIMVPLRMHKWQLVSDSAEKRERKRAEKKRVVDLISRSNDNHMLEWRKCDGHIKAQSKMVTKVKREREEE